MGTLNADFSSRISLRAVFAGTIITFASMSLLMTLGAALGFWNFKFSEFSTLGTGFWSFAFLAWVLSISVGSYVSSVASRSHSKMSGRLNGVTTWATSCIVGCLFLAAVTGSAFNSMNMGSSTGFYWGAFFGDSLALLAALWVAGIAVEFELKSPEATNGQTRPHRNTVTKTPASAFTSL
jgi:hypothetical protein